MSDYVPLTEHAELELRTEIERLHGEIERLREGEVVEERIQLRAEIERLHGECRIFITSNGGLTADLLAARGNLDTAAAFLDGLANRLDENYADRNYQFRSPQQAAADCRTMAAKLRGET